MSQLQLSHSWIVQAKFTVLIVGWIAGPENVDLEDTDLQGVMPRAISQV